MDDETADGQEPEVPESASLGGIADLEQMPGHWLLARMGKRVLRPGGLEFTEKLLRGLDIGPSKRVVELAPGLGATTELIAKCRPDSLIAVDRDPVAAERVRELLDNGEDYRSVVADASSTGLPDGCADVVLCEALLSLQSDQNKRRTLDEAFRLLRPGGHLGLHELCMRPDSVDLETQQTVRKELSVAVKLGARPLTVSAWRTLVLGSGFQIRDVSSGEMRLLEPRQFQRDEGLGRSLRIVCNVVRTPAARRRVRTMRATFRRHADHLGALAVVATKLEDPVLK